MSCRRGPRKKRLPRALLVGVGKCGSATLMTFLDLHPDIEIAKVNSKVPGVDPGEVCDEFEIT